jgi:hypothetical protein
VVRPDRNNPQTTPLGGRLIAGVFGLVFLGIGLTVMVSLWAEPFGGFGSPPVVFRLVGSFISLPFVAFGVLMCFAAIAGRVPPTMGRSSRGGNLVDDGQPQGPSSPGYSCPHCGAPLAEGDSISPHGDVKCAHCDCWFNIHGS